MEEVQVSGTFGIQDLLAAEEKVQVSGISGVQGMFPEEKEV